MKIAKIVVLAVCLFVWVNNFGVVKKVSPGWALELVKMGFTQFGQESSIASRCHFPVECPAEWSLFCKIKDSKEEVYYALQINEDVDEILSEIDEEMKIDRKKATITWYRLSKE